MRSRFTASVALLTLACSSSSLFAHYAHALLKGFYVGANVGSAFITGQQYNQITHDVPPTVYRNEASARGYHGAAFVGYQFYNDCRFTMSMDLSADFFSNRGRFTQHLYTDTNRTHFQESFDINHAINLTVHPGWKINDATIFYGVFGYSNARLEVEAKNLLPETANESPLVFDDHETLHGFIVGAGLQRQLTCQFGVFASYQYTYYGNASINDAVTGTGTEAPRYLTDRSLTLDSNVFKMGVVFSF